MRRIFIFAANFTCFFAFITAFAFKDTSPQVDEIKVALLGDTGAGGSFRDVLQLVRDERADVVMINGDLGYAASPEQWRKALESIIDTDQQLVIGALGNHDFERNNRDAYIRTFARWRTSENGLKANCTGQSSVERGQDIVALDETCTFGNVSIVASGIGQLFSRDYFEARLAGKLGSKPSSNWALVGYHYTLESMNPGLKGDEASHKFFDIIRQFGAIGAQAHTHSVMASCPITSLFSTRTLPECHQRFGANLNERFIAPGVGMFVDSSIGGMPARPRRRCSNHREAGCAHMIDLITREGYSRIDGKTLKSFETQGAMFIVFNEGGDHHRARVFFKSTDGQEVFSFLIRR